MKNISNVRLLAVVCVVVLVATAGWSSQKQDVQQKELTLLATINLPFTEPSGIAWSEKLQKLWVVSDDEDYIFILDPNGNVIDRFKFAAVDLEGITFDATDSTLWTIDERTREITHLDLNGKVLERKIVDYPSRKKNKGPEGIAIGKDRKLYLLNESKPSLLFELDSSYGIAHSYKLDFASDYSDIAYDESTNSFFILSDKSKAFFVWDPERGVTAEYALPGTSNEGIAFDRKRNVFYIVNDEEARLYIYTCR